MQRRFQSQEGRPRACGQEQFSKEGAGGASAQHVCEDVTRHNNLHMICGGEGGKGRGRGHFL